VNSAPPTLLSSCDGGAGGDPGTACRLVWDLTHNSQAAEVTREYIGAPLNVVLKVVFVALLALLCQVLVHRLINRLTERAARSFLPQFRRSARAAAPGARAATAAPSESGGRAEDHPAPAAVQAEAAQSEAVQVEAVQVEAVQVEAVQVEAAQAKAVQAEAALVDERRKQRVRALGAILRSASSVTIFVIAGFIILGDLSVNLAPLLASAGVLGVAIGFGAQSLVRDYLAGVFMLVEDQYGVGDVITIGEATGTVENVTLRVTRLRDVHGVVWHIRNGGVEAVGNQSQGWAQAVIDFPVPYESDLTEVRALLVRVGDRMWHDPAWRPVMLEAPEVWGAQELSGEAVVMRIVAKTAPLHQWEVEREMRTRAKTALHAAGIPPAAAPESTGGD
jgi:small-conductance mechanosensitive channel